MGRFPGIDAIVSRLDHHNVEHAVAHSAGHVTRKMANAQRRRTDPIRADSTASSSDSGPSTVGGRIGKSFGGAVGDGIGSAVDPRFGAEAGREAGEELGRELGAKVDSGINVVKAVVKSEAGPAGPAPPPGTKLPAMKAPGLLSRAFGMVMYPIGAVFNFVSSMEQLVSAAAEKFLNDALGIPTPSGPSLRVLDLCMGMPHGHLHPPNLIPPAPMIMLPSIGFVASIPYLSGASQTFVDSRHCARCGDMGMTMLCGSFFPFFEIFFGSSSVWVEGARSSRILLDFTKHCIFTGGAVPVKIPGGDPVVGPPLGMTLPSSMFTVMTGGFPFPSATDFLMGQGFLKLFGLFGKIGKLIARKSRVARVLAEAVRRRAGAMAKRLMAAKKFVLDASDDAYAAVRGNLGEVLRKRKARKQLAELVDKNIDIAPHWAPEAPPKVNTDLPDLSDFEKALPPEQRGMLARHDEGFRLGCKEEGVIQIVRDSEAVAVKHIEGATDPNHLKFINSKVTNPDDAIKGLLPKRVDLKGKTLRAPKHGPDGKTPWKEGDPIPPGFAHPDNPRIGLASAHPENPGVKAMADKEGGYDNFKKNLEAKGYRVGPEPDCIITDANGNAFHSDYDMHDVYQPGTGHDMMRTDGTVPDGFAARMDEAQGQGMINRQNARFGTSGERGMIQHGGQGTWAHADNPAKVSGLAGPKPPATAYTPDGQAYRIENAEQLRRFQERTGKRWRFRNTAP